jgi:hypothetical protein
MGMPDPASPYNTSTLPQQDPTSQETTGDHRLRTSALLHSLWKLNSLCMVEAGGVTLLTFEDESIPCILLANLGQLSTWGLPGFGL